MTLRAWLNGLALSGLLWSLGIVAAAKAHVPGCHTKACDRRVHDSRARRWCKRHAVCVWRHRWMHLPGWERTWATCVANAETRGIPWSRKAATATGNGYYGATQWLPRTWRAAGGQGLPTQHTLHEQLVRTVWWARRAGPSQWSTSAGCGR